MASWEYILNLLLLTISATAATANTFIPTLTIPRDDSSPHNRVSRFYPDDFITSLYNQTLDHFSYRPESYTIFKQRYVINSKYWGGASSSAPIFVFLGEETSIDSDIPNIGFLYENAPRFKALLLYIEHRFYGESIPFGLSLEKALKNANTRGYFSSAQALADYAEIILHVKQNLKAENSPVIVFGGSYGGMLAAWFRLKYPHIAYAALASSAPILILNDFVSQYGYYDVVSKDFEKTSKTCYETIKSSWLAIDQVASKLNGLVKLSKMFKTCKPLEDVSELKNYLIGIYAGSAQYNSPFRKPVTKVCNAIDNPQYSNDVLGKIFSGVVAYSGNTSCYINAPTNATQTDLGWPWQTCSDMVYSLARGNDTMFQHDPAPVQDYVDYCLQTYGVTPRPHWAPTYFGGRDIKRVLHRFGSNIIFSNGLVDPYSSGGVLEDISDTLRAVYTVNGSHCLDILTSRDDDPDWLVKQRKTEIALLAKWIARYYANLRQIKADK